MEMLYAERGASIKVLGLDEPGAVVSPVFQSQWTHVKEALRRIPDAHLLTIPRIVIGDRPSGGGAFLSNPHEIRLNRRTFAADHNHRYLFTLLHEIGHAVDHHYHIVSAFTRQSRKQGAEWTAFRAIVYRGRNVFPPGHADAGTPRYGEHFAEGYAHLLTRPAALTSTQQALIRRLARL